MKAAIVPPFLSSENPFAILHVGVPPIKELAFVVVHGRFPSEYMKPMLLGTSKVKLSIN